MRVNIDVNRELFRRRWTYQGKRYSLSTRFDGNKSNCPFAERKAHEIEVDVIAGVFDETLAKYNPKARPELIKYISAYRLVQLFIEDKSKAVLGKSLGHYGILLRAVGEKVGEKLDVSAVNAEHVNALFGVHHHQGHQLRHTTYEHNEDR